MKVYSPYERVSENVVKAGQIVMFDVAGKLALFLVVSYKNGEVGYLGLDGECVGKIEYPTNGKVFLYKEDVKLVLPHEASGWSGVKQPTGPLLVAIASGATYFVYSQYDKLAAANIVTGEITDSPYQANYVNHWAIFSSASENPLVQGVTPD